MTVAEAVFTRFDKGAYGGGGSEESVLISGRSVRAGVKRGVVIHGGWGQTAASNSDPDDIGRMLLRAGIPQINTDFVDGKQWGNDTVQSGIGSSWGYLRTEKGAKADKALLYGASMGGLCALNWARANPTLVAAVALLIPVVDLADMHDSNRGGYAASIEAAYTNLAGYTAAVAAHNPAVHASDFASIPIKAWYSGNDPVALPGPVTSFVSGAGSASAVNMGNLGHSTVGAPASTGSDIAAFLAANA